MIFKLILVVVKTIIAKTNHRLHRLEPTLVLYKVASLTQLLLSIIFLEEVLSLHGLMIPKIIIFVKFLAIFHLTYLMLHPVKL